MYLFIPYCTTVYKAMRTSVVYLLCMYELFIYKCWETDDMAEIMDLYGMLIRILLLFRSMSFFSLLTLTNWGVIYTRAVLGLISMSHIKPIFLVILYKMLFQHTSSVARTIQKWCCAHGRLLLENPTRTRHHFWRVWAT